MILFATHTLAMIIICATLFNPTIDDQVMGRHKQVLLKSMFKISDKGLSADCDTDLLS